MSHSINGMPNLTVDDLAARLRVNRNTLYYHIWKGALKYEKLGRFYRFDEAEVKRFEESRNFCLNGHPRNSANIRFSNGKKRCRLCCNKWTREARNRKELNMDEKRITQPRMTVYREPEPSPPAPMPYRYYRCAGCGNEFKGSPGSQALHYCLEYHCYRRNKQSTLSSRSRKALAELAESKRTQ